MWSKALAIVLLCFCVNLAVADPRAIQIHRRDGPTTPSVTGGSTTQSSNSAQSSDGSGSKNGGDSTTNQANPASSTSTPASHSTSSSGASTSSSITVSAVISNINGPAPTQSINNSDFNATATPDELPLTPEITPAFAVAGVILILTGWCYLASLGVTVLILYVMNPPISNAIQGAYLVAIALTGLILGGAAIVFPEMTEGFGSLLGGFCFSMWLLVLKPGGLLTSTGGKAAFIAAFTVAVFATSFSHITRPYGLIGSISFGGATILVLGIDCFSRAGLKEFWAYIWNLNDNLFPVGATTYPLTRGIRVEIAAIVVISLAGIVSQMKLWKVIKERREQRAAVRLQDERSMEEEEEKVGRRIQLHNARERNRWEAAHGDKDATQSHEQLPYRDSGVGDMESQKKGPTSTMTSLGSSVDDQIEEAPMRLPTPSRGTGLVMASRGQDGGPITVRVARDPEHVTVVDEKGNPVEPSPNILSNSSAPVSPQEESQEGKIWAVGTDVEARFERSPSHGKSKQLSSVPEVVPLPFKVPDGDVEDDRSSVATFADDECAAQTDTLSIYLQAQLSCGDYRKCQREAQRNLREVRASALRI